jgi:hypothetical protein
MKGSPALILLILIPMVYAQPPPPALWSPPVETKTADHTPSFQWQVVENATKYELALDNDPDFSSPELIENLTEENLTTIVLEVGLPVKKFVVPDRLSLPDGTFYWRVRAYDNQGMPGRWSEKRKIVIYTISIGTEFPIFELEDPVGDDFGPGTYTYPTSWEFGGNQSGAFDLTRFKVTEDERSYIFRFWFRDLRDDPWGGPNGFSLQHIQVYLDTAPGGRKDALPWTNIAIGDPWEYAMVIGPGWSGHRDDSHTNLLVLENGDRYKDVIEITADHENNMILAAVPKHYFTHRNPKQWKYTVLVFSHDGYSLGCIREVALNAETWRGGGADNRAYIQVIDGKLGVSPNAYDVLAKTVEEQIRMLKSYRLSEDPKGASYATVYGVGGEVHSFKRYLIVLVVIAAVLVLIWRKRK